MEMASFSEYCNRVYFACKNLKDEKLSEVIELLKVTVESKGRIWIVGNGGSAATASHFATDLSRCSNSVGEPVRAISLCDNSSLITAIGNDFGFYSVFSRQLSKAATKGDLLIVISASGNSKNLLKAIEWAKDNGVKTLTLTGFDGGKANNLADTSLHVPTSTGDYGVAEDTHSILCHFLSSQFRDYR